MRHVYLSQANEKACARVQELKDKLTAICEELDAIPAGDLTPKEHDAIAKAVEYLGRVDMRLADQFT